MDLMLTGNGIVDSETETALRVRSENLGAGGMKVVSEYRLAEGTEVRIRTCGDSPDIRFYGNGKVTRVERSRTDESRWECGIHFTKVDDETRYHLSKFVEFGAGR
jgi:c-di-GMP-binding flagellar brake protein YcgR